MHILKPPKAPGLSPAETDNAPPDKKYDAIVVGAGPAGSTAAYFMASSGLDVLFWNAAPIPGRKIAAASVLSPSIPISFFRIFGKSLTLSGL